MCLRDQVGRRCPTSVRVAGCQAAVSEVWMKGLSLMMHVLLAVCSVAIPPSPPPLICRVQKHFSFFTLIRTKHFLRLYDLREILTGQGK